jgi:hypothetical protein
MAGLLTYSFSSGLPIHQQNSGVSLPESKIKSLQQRELFLIFTGFPIMTLSAKTQYTIADAKVNK